MDIDRATGTDGLSEESRKASGNVTHRTKVLRAKRDAAKTAASFGKDNDAAIRIIRNFYNGGMQHVLSLRLDAQRQRFSERHDLDPCIVAQIWFDTCESHPEIKWVMCDLELERDRREGRAHHWKRYSWAPGVEHINGTQLDLGLEREESATA